MRRIIWEVMGVVDGCWLRLRSANGGKRGQLMEEG